jgi:hypothetical protein
MPARLRFRAGVLPKCNAGALADSESHAQLIQLGLLGLFAEVLSGLTQFFAESFVPGPSSRGPRKTPALMRVMYDRL